MTTRSRTTTNQGGLNLELASAIRRRFLQIVVALILMASALFLSAGRLDWPMAWIYFGSQAVGVAVTSSILLSRDPELIAERGRVRENAPTWDRVLAPFVAVAGPLATYVVAGLDRRYSWSTDLGVPLPVAALVVALLSYAMIAWSMASNSFFSGLVSIQSDRGHTVASSGPYGWVRHPGYVGMVALQLAAPVVLGSMWALVPAGLATLLMVLRTALEDRYLHKELAGYADYAARVRYRLAPGIW